MSSHWASLRRCLAAARLAAAAEEDNVSPFNDEARLLFDPAEKEVPAPPEPFPAPSVDADTPAEAPEGDTNFGFLKFFADHAKPIDSSLERRSALSLLLV